MKNLVGIVIGCLITSFSFAQDARSPGELAAYIQKAIQTKNTTGVEKLIHSSNLPESAANYRSVLEAYFGAVNLKVYAVPKDNAVAVRQFLALSPTPGAIKPVDEQVKKLESWGSYFALQPIGHLVVSGRQAHDKDPKSEGSMSSVMYGTQDGKYLIVFGRQK